MGNTILGANGNQGEYEIENSAVFGDTGSFLTRSQSDNESDADRRKFTISGWYKQTGGGSASGWNGFWSAMVDSNNYTSLKKNNNGDAQLIFELKLSGTGKTFTLTQKIRDFTAWYNIVVAFDSTDGTAADRLKVYVNGEQAAGTFSADITQNDSAHWGDDASTARLGAYNNNTGDSYMHNGYMADVSMTVGYALGPDAFGKTNANGIWVPKKPQVTYSANGFLCEFKQTGSSANSSGIGADTSGNDNHFTIDQDGNAFLEGGKIDTPTNNFPTFNREWRSRFDNDGDWLKGNLRRRFTSENANRGYGVSTIGVSAGKWYWECKIYQVARASTGVFDANAVADFNQVFYDESSSKGFQVGTSGAINENNTSTNYANSLSDNDIIMWALDMDNHRAWYGINGTWQDSGDPTSGSTGTGDVTTQISDQTAINTGEFMFPFVADMSTSGKADFEINFGSPIYTISSGNSDANGYGNFEYAVPSGFYAICTKNIAEYG